MEKEKDFGRIGVALGEGKKVEVVVANVEILSTGLAHGPLVWTAPGSFAYIYTLV